MKLKDKVAIITGASKGIGKAMAFAMGKEGAKVVISSRKQAAVDEVANEFRKEGIEAIGIECHVGKQEDLQLLVEKTVAKYGGIDILVNNAGTNPTFGPMIKMENWAYDKTMQINLWGPYELSRLVVPHMAERGGGAIINISSVEGLSPSPGMGVYSISKAGLIMLTKVQAREWGGIGIRSNAICPGFIQTKLSQFLFDNKEIIGKIMEQQSLKHQGEPEDIAGLAVMLASDEARFISGAVITADGGLTV